MRPLLPALRPSLPHLPSGLSVSFPASVHRGFLCSEQLLAVHIFSLPRLFHLILFFTYSCHLLSSLAHLLSFPLVLYSPLVPPLLRTSFEAVVVCHTWLVGRRFKLRAVNKAKSKGWRSKDPRHRDICSGGASRGPGTSRQGQTWLHFTCLQEASVLPSVCPSARPPPFTSSLGMVNSSSSCCSSVKFGFGAVSLWPFSRQSEGSTPLPVICVAGEAPAAFPEPGSDLCGDVAVPPARGSGAAPAALVLGQRTDRPVLLFTAARGFSFPFSSWLRTAMRELVLWRGQSRCTHCRNSWNLERRR